jgi:hypothetical protein
MCYLLFNHYIEHDTIKDSIYTSLLGKTDPQNILLHCVHCASNFSNCYNDYIHTVYYDSANDSYANHSTYISEAFILLACYHFKNLNVYDLLDNL